MSFRNRVARSARKNVSAFALITLVTAANPSAVAQPIGSFQEGADWRIAWSLIWNFATTAVFGVANPESAQLADETPPPPPPPPPPPTDNQSGGGTAGGSGPATDPNGR